MKKEIQERLISICSDVGLMLTELETESDVNLMDQIEDSLQFMNLIIAIEEGFQIEMPDEFLIWSDTLSFQALMELICKLSND